MRTTYRDIEPRNSMKSSLESAMNKLREEKDSPVYSQEYIDIVIGQLKYYVKEDVVFYALEIKSIFNFLSEVFNIQQPADIIKEI